MTFRGFDLMCQIVGRRHARCEFANFDVGTDEWRAKRQEWLRIAMEYARDLDDHLRTGRNLILLGPVGTGKDHLAVSVLRVAVGRGISCCYRRGSMLIEEMRRSNVEKGVRVPHRYRSVPLLAISDIEPRRSESQGQATDFEERAFLDLIDSRYCAQLPTIVTTNAVGRSALNRVMGPPLVDRLLEGAIGIATSGPSYRQWGAHHGQ